MIQITDELCRLKKTERAILVTERHPMSDTVWCHEKGLGGYNLPGSGRCSLGKSAFSIFFWLCNNGAQLNTDFAKTENYMRHF